MTSHAGPPDLTSFARNQFTINCHSTAILALLVWDFGLLFGDEFKYIWMRQKSLFSLFWFLLRYPIILSHIFVVAAFFSNGWSAEVRCVGWTQAKIFLVWVSIFSGRICWCLRTYALWNRPRWLLVVGVPAVIMESAMILFATLKISYVPIPPGLRPICIASPGEGFWSIMAWVVPFGFDTTLSSLSIVRAMRVSRKLKTPLTTQLIRDGFWYYGLMTTIYVVGLVLYAVDPMRLFIMGHTMIGLLGLISARFLLNLRMLKSEDQEYKSRYIAAACTSETVSDGVTFGVLTGVEGFVDQFELDDARKGGGASISLKTIWDASIPSRTSLPA